MKRLRPSPALLVAIVALVAALAGTAVGGVAVTSLNSKDKKQVKKIAKKQAKKLDKKIELKPGPPGEDATKLFAYIAQPVVGSPEVEYGAGVTGVGGPSGPLSEYVVSFERSLVGCVVSAIPGLGNPLGVGTGVRDDASASVNMNQGSDNQVAVLLTDDNGLPVEASFLITAFC